MFRSHLHATDIDGEDCGEEEHLQKEIGHQANHSKQTELLQGEDTVNTGG